MLLAVENPEWQYLRNDEVYTMEYGLLIRNWYSFKWLYYY